MEVSKAISWRTTLPVIEGEWSTLRGLRPDDAASLFAGLTAGEVARFINPPPTTFEGFERFIEWSQEQRTTGHGACFAVLAKNRGTTIGLIQVRRADAASATAEWGFAIASFFWGTGIFPDAARLVIDFAFDAMGIERLEARAALSNGRGNGALRKIGAVREGVSTGSLQLNGETLDEALWVITRDDWRRPGRPLRSPWLPAAPSHLGFRALHAS
jgi:ribosomal-protein-alanine N-acetyltransferase